MDPLRARLEAVDPRRRRLLVVLGVVVAAVVLAVAVGLAAAGGGGSTAVLPRIRTAQPVTATPTPLLVQVVGAVRHPGVVAVAAGARVLDAVAAAGGGTADADLGQVPLATVVADGQRIEVPRRGAATSAPGVAASASGATTGARISLSTATVEQLETLPRIGPAMAARIVAWRQAHGGFRSVADLQQVSGIGPKTYAALKDLVTP